MRSGQGSAGEVSPRVNGRRDGTWTVIELIRWSGEYLVGKGVVRGRLDAEHILGHVLGVSRLQLYLEFDRPLAAEELAAYKALLLRRAGREPLQYILGEAGFRELLLRVDSRALIPRPETEELVGAVLDWTGERESRGVAGDLAALDVGTGSGCIALSLATEGPFTRVVATDASPEALSLARENAARLDVGRRVSFVPGTLFEPVADQRFDVVVSNPPYVAEGDLPSLEPEVGRWEPRGALVAGGDGLDVVRPLVAASPDHVLPGGLLALEVGLGQDAAVVDLIRATGGFHEPAVRKDLAGRPRIVTAVRRAALNE